MLGVVFFVHLPIVDQHILKVGEGKVAQCISGFTAMDVAPPRGPLCLQWGAYFAQHVFALWSVCPQGLTEKLWIGLENFVFHWLINADRVVSQVEYPSLVDLRGLFLDLVAQLLGAISRFLQSLNRFSSVTERFFMEVNTRRIDTSGARSETLSIINGMRYIKLGVKTEGGLNASASFVAKANPLNRAPHKRKSELHHALCNMLSNILAPLADGRKGKWPPPGVNPSLNLWSEAVARIRVQHMHWRDKQSKHIAVSK
ncbi:furry homolog-like protein [Tanacetum coccineum]